MILTFEQREDTKSITLEELNEFEAFIGRKLPEDYRQHMLTHNGSMVVEDVMHVDYPEGGGGVSYFDSIKYGSDPMEEIYASLLDKIPDGYLCIGMTDIQGHIIMSLNEDSTYGHIKEYFSDGDMNDLSPSFTQLLNDMRLSDDEEEE